MAKSSKSAVLLAGHTDPALLDVVYDFSRNLACAWQAQLELQPFLGENSAASKMAGADVKAGMIEVRTDR